MASSLSASRFRPYLGHLEATWTGSEAAKTWKALARPAPHHSYSDNRSQRPEIGQSDRMSKLGLVDAISHLKLRSHVRL
jgi:hypothetical protein